MLQKTLLHKLSNLVGRKFTAICLFAVGSFFSINAQAQTIYALSSGNLYSFDAGTPAITSFVGTISGITAGQGIEGLDFRPSTGQLYALGYDRNAQTAQIYTVNLMTAVATPVNITPISLVLGPVGVSRLEVTFDFNPTVDRIRVMSNRDYNYRLNPNNGLISFTDLTVNYAGADVNVGINPYVATGAYTNSYIGSTSTILYDIDAQLKVLAKQDPPNNGTLNTIGSLGGGVNKNLSAIDMDIYYDVATQTNIAYVTGNSNFGSDFLATINLTTGDGTLSAASVGGLFIDDIACYIDRTVPELTGNLVYALNSTNFLLGMDANNTSIIRTSVPVTGITLNQVIVGMDFRPATGDLYALGYNSATNESQLYTVNTSTGIATAVNVTPTILILGGNNVAVDFNPFVDKIRVVSANNANYRLNVDGTLFFTDLNLNYGVVDINFGADPMIGACAYTNSYAGTPSTSLYNYDQALNIITNQNPPNDGVLITIGSSRIMQNLTDPTTDMDIYYNSVSNEAYLSANTGVSTFDNLYMVDIMSGTATNLGKIGNGIAVKNIAVPLMGDMRIFGGVINTAGKLKVDIFPNPVHDLLTVQFHLREASVANVKVFNLFGGDTGIGFAQLVNANGSVTLDVSALVPGSYVIKVQADSRTSSQSFVKF